MSAQLATTTTDPYAGRKANSYKVQQGIYLLLGVVEVVIGARFVLRLLGANADAGFAQFIYGLSAPLVAPFLGLFGTIQTQGSVFEPQSLIALVVYALVGWLVVKLAWQLLGETRSASATTTDSTVAR